MTWRVMGTLFSPVLREEAGEYVLGDRTDAARVYSKHSLAAEGEAALASLLEVVARNGDEVRA